MSDFKYSSDEILNGDPAVFAREINKQQPDPRNPVKTTSSLLGGNEDFLSTLSVGQLLMGVPATNSQTDIYGLLDTMVGSIVSAGQVAKTGAGAVATVFDYLVPGDIAHDALNWITGTGGKLGSGDGGTGGAGVTGPLPGGIASSDVPGTFPTNTDFITQCAKQLGKSYTQNNPQRLGPDQYDCSGFVYAALVAIGISPPVPSVSGPQWQWCADDPHRKGGGHITLDQALHIPGALIFNGTNGNEHVAVSDGAGGQYAAHKPGRLSSHVNTISGYTFVDGGLIPGMFYKGLDGKV